MTQFQIKGVLGRHERDGGGQTFKPDENGETFTADVYSFAEVLTNLKNCLTEDAQGVPVYRWFVTDKTRVETYSLTASHLLVLTTGEIGQAGACVISENDYLVMNYYFPGFKSHIITRFHKEGWKMVA